MAGRDSTVLVTGATSLVGHFLLPRLLQEPLTVHALSRVPPADVRPGLHWHAVDIERGRTDLMAITATLAFHLAPLWLLPKRIDDLAALGVRRLIAFGSTSRFTKMGSANPYERDVARRLADAEDATAQGCARHGIAWTIFRPTIIYGGGRDRSLTSLARVIRRFGFFPVAGAARGLRQPVHADDLALACLLARDAGATFGRAYDLTGGSTLSYRAMLAVIAQGVGRRPRLLTLPLPAVRAAVRCARLWPRYRHLSPEMANRMNEDLCFDSGEAARDFGYTARPFVHPVI
jgi:nucleoside-diphosphate-sugar epimerase